VFRLLYSQTALFFLEALWTTAQIARIIITGYVADVSVLTIALIAVVIQASLRK
jgi:hypothetical protein